MHLLQEAVQCSALQSVLSLCILIVVGLLQLLKTRTKHFGRPCQVALPGKLWMSILGMSNHPHSFASHDACVLAPMQHHQSGRACNMVLLSYHATEAYPGRVKAATFIARRMLAASVMSMHAKGSNTCVLTKQALNWPLQLVICLPSCPPIPRLLFTASSYSYANLMNFCQLL